MTAGWNRWQKIVAFHNNQDDRKWEHGYSQHQRQDLQAVAMPTFSAVGLIAVATYKILNLLTLGHKDEIYSSAVTE
jgi:hypothetical protein